MTTDTDTAALRTRLEAIVKEAEDTEEQAAAARRRVQATRLVLEEEETKAAALEQTAIAARQCVSTSSSAAASASQIVPATSSSYEDTVVDGLHLQATAVLNVRQLVNVVLDSFTNYASWRDLMEQALQCYALIEHVTADAPSNARVDSDGQCHPQLDQQFHLVGASSSGPGTWLYGVPPLARH
jgi:hypothetical protein